MIVESVKSVCPHCGEVIELLIDTSVSTQEYIEDCQVCCCPMLIKVEVNLYDETVDNEIRNDYIQLEVTGDI